MVDVDKEMDSLKREVGIWRTVAHALQMYAMVTMDGERVQKLIGLICDWSYAHRQGNGMLDNDVLVAKALERLANHEKAAVVPGDVKPRSRIVLEQLAKSLASAPRPHNEIALNAKIEIERLVDEGSHLAGEVKRLERELQNLRESRPHEPAGEVVVSTNDAGECVAVTRQNEEHQILSVIWERGESASSLQKEVWKAVGGPAPV